MSRSCGSLMGWKRAWITGRHPRPRNDRAGMAYHNTGETMSGPGGFNRRSARTPRGDVGGGKTVAGRGGIDDGLCQRLWRHLLGSTFEPHDARRPQAVQGRLTAANALDQLIVAFIRVERQQILRRSQHNVGGCKGLVKDSASDVGIRPAPGAEVGVE